MQGCSQTVIVPCIVLERTTPAAELYSLLFYLHVAFMLIFVTPEDVLEKTVQFVSGAKSLSVSNRCFSLLSQAATDGICRTGTMKPWQQPKRWLGRASRSLEEMTH